MYFERNVKISSLEKKMLPESDIYIKKRRPKNEKRRLSWKE
jgi:hypothetical protein